MPKTSEVNPILMSYASKLPGHWVVLSKLGTGIFNMGALQRINFNGAFQAKAMQEDGTVHDVHAASVEGEQREGVPVQDEGSGQGQWTLIIKRRP